MKKEVNEELILKDAEKVLKSLIGHTFDVLSISKPPDQEYAIFLSKINSKLSSIIGNMIEEKMANHLNEKSEFNKMGKWIRQDPGFPDNIFVSDELTSIPGIEVKAWLPFSTEITGRFKISQNLLENDNTVLALVVWMPEYILHGRPQILDILIEPASKVAESRDNHYFNPPNYILNEPLDTTARSINLQQQNVEGYVFQGDHRQLKQAKEIVDDLKLDMSKYPPSEDLLLSLNQLRQKFNYRLDTNFAKINRINNKNINKFKKKVFKIEKFSKPISFWKNISKKNTVINHYLDIFEIKNKSN